MLYYAWIFLAFAAAAFIIGFLGQFIVGSAVLIAKFCFFVFLILFIVFLCLGCIKKARKKE